MRGRGGARRRYLDVTLQQRDGTIAYVVWNDCIRSSALLASWGASLAVAHD